MDLIIVRHGHAVDVGIAGVTEDSQRYLTEEGKLKVARAGKFISSRDVSVDRIYTSPLVRARETSEILDQMIHSAGGIVKADSLAPGEWDSGEGILGELNGEICIVVGHNPDLEELASACLDPDVDRCIELKKAAVCWIAFDGRAKKGAGVLRMLLPPAALSFRSS